MTDYKFDFTNLTALDAAKVASGDNWRICEVINTTIEGGLGNYKPNELMEITRQFGKKFVVVYASPMAKLINNLGKSQ